MRQFEDRGTFCCVPRSYKFAGDCAAASGSASGTASAFAGSAFTESRGPTERMAGLPVPVTELALMIWLQV